MVTQAPKRSATLIAIAFSLSCIGLIIFVWVTFGGSVPLAAQGYRVRAVFSETGQLVANEDVRIAGVNVGKTEAVIPDGSKSLVVMDIDPRFAPIPTDTRAILREKTLLGEGYVELSSGSHNGAKLPDGGTIPNDQVASTQQLDQVLNAFTPSVQHDFETFLDGTGSSLVGQGQNLNDAFGNVGPLATELDELSSTLNAEGPSLSQAISGSGSVLTALGDRGNDLQTIIRSGDQVFTATSSENRALRQTVSAFPPFLSQLKLTLGQLGQTLAVAKPSLDVLEPVAPLARPALANLVSVSGTFERFLQAAPGTLREARTVLPYLTAFVNQLGPLVNTTLPAAQQIVPVINVVREFRPQITLGMVDLAALLNAQTSANTTSDADGIAAGQAKYVRQLLTLGPDTSYGQSTRNPAVRSNPYFSPTALSTIGTTGETAASCAGAGSGGNVPCQLQPSYDWGTGIGTSYYPRVKAAAP